VLTFSGDKGKQYEILFYGGEMIKALNFCLRSRRRNKGQGELFAKAVGVEIILF